MGLSDRLRASALGSLQSQTAPHMAAGLRRPHLTQAALEMLLYPKPAPLPGHRRVLMYKNCFFILHPFLEIQVLYCGYFPKRLLPSASL